jgi:glucose 1-dehydrogenase
MQILVPSKRIGEAEDISCAVVWLASDDADYVTGLNLYVDGGMTLYARTQGCTELTRR